MRNLLLFILVMLLLVISSMDGNASPDPGLYSLTKEVKQYLKDGNSEKALEIANEAVKQYKDSPISYYYVAKASDQLGKADEAIEAYEKSLALHSENFYALNNLGLLYISKGKLEEAKTNLEKAVEMDGPEAYAFNNLGIIYERLGMKEKAIEAYEKALEIKPDYEKVKVNLARVAPGE